MVQQILYVARKMNVRRDCIFCFEKLFNIKQQQRQRLSPTRIQRLVLKRELSGYIYLQKMPENT